MSTMCRQRAFDRIQHIPLQPAPNNVWLPRMALDSRTNIPGVARAFCIIRLGSAATQISTLPGLRAALGWIASPNAYLFNMYAAAHRCFKEYLALLIEVLIVFGVVLGVSLFSSLAHQHPTSLPVSMSQEGKWILPLSNQPDIFMMIISALG